MSEVAVFGGGEPEKDLRVSTVWGGSEGVNIRSEMLLFHLHI